MDKNLRVAHVNETFMIAHPLQILSTAQNIYATLYSQGAFVPILNARGIFLWESATYPEVFSGPKITGKIKVSVSNPCRRVFY